MKKGLLFLILIIIILSFLSYRILKISLLEKKEETYMEGEKILENKKIAQIIAFRDFRDEEYFIPRNIFLQKGAKVKTVSDKEGIAIGANGGEAKVDLKLEELNIDEFDAILFTGGPGALDHLDKEISYEIAKKTLGSGKVLGAICISPVILAKAGVLEGKKATVWSSTLDKEPIKILEENGVIFVDERVVRDGNIVTGNGPAAAKEFAEKIIEVLTEK